MNHQIFTIISRNIFQQHYDIQNASVLVFRLLTPLAVLVLFPPSLLCEKMTHVSDIDTYRAFRC